MQMNLQVLGKVLELTMPVLTYPWHKASSFQTFSFLINYQVIKWKIKVINGPRVDVLLFILIGMQQHLKDKRKGKCLN